MRCGNLDGGDDCIERFASPPTKHFKSTHFKSLEPQTKSMGILDHSKAMAMLISVDQTQMVHHCLTFRAVQILRNYQRVIKGNLNCKLFQC